MVAGVSDHAGWAVVVCVKGGEVVDRRRIELIEPGLPTLPHHHEAQGLPDAEAIELIERVRRSADACARKALAGLPPGVVGIAIRKRPRLPATIPERIANYRAQCVADTVMYRDALEGVAHERGWFVKEYEPNTVFQEAAAALGLEDVSERLREIGKELGSPWGKDQRLAMAGAVAATNAAPESAV